MPLDLQCSTHNDLPYAYVCQRCERVLCSAGPDGRQGSAPPADGSGSMGRAVSEAALYTQLSALHRSLVRSKPPELRSDPRGRLRRHRTTTLLWSAWQEGAAPASLLARLTLNAPAAPAGRGRRAGAAAKVCGRGGGGGAHFCCAARAGRGGGGRRCAALRLRPPLGHAARHLLLTAGARRRIARGQAL